MITLLVGGQTGWFISCINQELKNLSETEPERSRCIAREDSPCLQVWRPHPVFCFHMIISIKTRKILEKGRMHRDFETRQTRGSRSPRIENSRERAIMKMKERSKEIKTSRGRG